MWFFFICSRINKGDIEAEFQKQVKKVEDAKVDTLQQEDLKAQMDGFLDVSPRFCVQFSLTPVQSDMFTVCVPSRKPSSA